MRLSLIFTAALCLFLSACEKVEQSETKMSAQLGQISGEVFYRERKLLPPGAYLEVSLEDVSKMDVASTVMGAMKQDVNGAPPYAFSLEYDTSKIEPKRSYSLRAKIMIKDKLLMTSTESLDPFKANGKDIKIRLSMVNHNKRNTSAGKPDTGLAVVSVNPLADLSNTYWKLTSLQGQAVVMGEKQKREAFLQLNGKDESIKGFAGCNQMMGSYKSNGNKLSFNKLGATRKACIEGMETEAAFMQILSDTQYFSIHEHNMTLLNADKKPIAKFKAQYFN